MPESKRRTRKPSLLGTQIRVCGKDMGHDVVCLLRSGHHDRRRTHELEVHVAIATDEDGNVVVGYKAGRDSETVWSFLRE